VALAVVIAWETRVLPIGTPRIPGAGLWPLAAAAALGVLGALIALRGGGPALAGLRWLEARRAGLVLVAASLAAWAFERVGYRLTVFLLLLLFLGAVERRPPLAVAAVSLGLSLGTFYLFADLLRVPLPRGPWGL
jgi:hypothetical protein